jgi:hypothetical protein
MKERPILFSGAMPFWAAESGETFMPSATPVWVRLVAVALSVAQPAEVM